MSPRAQNSVAEQFTLSAIYEANDLKGELDEMEMECDIAYTRYPNTVLIVHHNFCPNPPGRVSRYYYFWFSGRREL